MPTASTKHRARKNTRGENIQQGDAAAAKSSDAVVSANDALTVKPGEPFVISERVWLIAAAAILLVAACLRLYALELKPFHHDEGVNGFFLTNLVRNGVYRYDPSNYHGPTLYYFALVPANLLEKVFKTGMTTFSVRLIPALFGLATVWLALCLRRYIGTFGTLVAAALIAVSPGAVYQSRYFIHEMIFVFFTFGIVVALIRFYETREALYAMLAFASAALLFATKETAFISVGVLGLAALVGWVLVKDARRVAARNNARLASKKARGKIASAAAPEVGPTTIREHIERLGGGRRLAILSLAGSALFLFLCVLFYSSFFKYREGVAGAIESLKIWTKTGTSDFHSKPFETYLIWLWQMEAPILMLALCGACCAVFERRKKFFPIFVSAWAFGMLAAYSLVPYKTPWLSLSFVVPLAIAGGYGMQVLMRWTSSRWVRAEMKLMRHAPALALAALAVGIGLTQAIILNFYQYDNDQYIYVYSHTKRDLLRLVNIAERAAYEAGTGKATPIAIVTPESDYWPLPWYLRDYKSIGYQTQIGDLKEPIIIARRDLEEKLKTAAGNSYQRIGDVYPLRPGVDLVLYVRSDIRVEP